jgi:hypothetical protein
MGHIDDVVEGYTTLASSLLKRWSKLASNAATKLDAGDYDAADAAEDWAAGATLATEGGLRWAAETAEAFAGCVGLEAGPNVVSSLTFRAPAGAKLELYGPLVKGAKLDELPTRVVRIEPAQLGPTETEFKLQADASGYRGATYVGAVKASTDAGSKLVPVWIVVP